MNRRTAFMLTGMTSLGLALAALPQVGFAQSNPWLGTWKADAAKSTYSPGPAPRSQTLTYQADGQALRVTVETIDAQGNPQKQVLLFLDDGKSHPIMGVPAYDAASYKMVNDSTYWLIRTKGGKLVQTLTSVLAADGKIETTTIAGVNANGQQIYNVIVRDKQ
jgi:hypothetical protein